MREKKRYIVYESSAKAPDVVFSSIQSALEKFLGILGMSKVNPEIMKDKFKNGRGIIRINHKYKDEVITGLTFSEVKVGVIGVSGILKKAEERYMEE